MGLVVAGERSGVGKTTVTLALLASLCRRKQQVQSFKVGPDYIDPMFHQSVTGCACRNLDPVLTSEAYVQQCFATHSQTADWVLVEGVMGLFDGATGRHDWASTAHVARLLELPVLLVLDCSHLSRSVAAIVHGYRSFDPTMQLAGVILNRVGSDRHLELLQAALEPLHVPILGVLRRQDAIALPSRHLGLVPTAELAQLNAVIDKLAHLGDICFDWQQLLPLLKRQKSEVRSQKTIARNIPASEPFPKQFKTQNISCGDASRATLNTRLAVARDRAFSFYYADNLELLQQLGAELLFWSPLRDRTLPPGTQGLYFGGGFPEVFAQELAQNHHALHAVRAAIQDNMPTYAECGGLMYLSQSITDFEQQCWPMVGAIPTATLIAKRLTLGYRRATVLRNSPLVTAGTSVWGHEFHRSTLTTNPEMPLYNTWRYDQKTTEPAYSQSWQLQQLHASYVHLHFGATPTLPQRFLQHCDRYSA